MWIIILAFYLISNTHSWMNVFFIMKRPCHYILALLLLELACFQKCAKWWGGWWWCKCSLNRCCPAKLLFKPSLAACSCAFWRRVAMLEDLRSSTGTSWRDDPGPPLDWWRRPAAEDPAMSELPTTELLSRDPIALVVGGINEDPPRIELAEAIIEAAVLMTLMGSGAEWEFGEQIGELVGILTRISCREERLKGEIVKSWKVRIRCHAGGKFRGRGCSSKPLIFL